MLAPGNIPIVHSDRGGQVTYHGPGQLIVYVLMDTRRLGVGPRELVQRLEQGTIDYLATLGLDAARKPGAPGVYIGASKIAALGLRIRRGCSYHGIALNVDVDLEPFNRINPCGYAGLSVTRVIDHGIDATVNTTHARFVAALERTLMPSISTECLNGQSPLTESQPESELAGE